jgi:hypothetical protein
MVSEKAIVVILIIAILLSVFSIILTASISIKTPVVVKGPQKTEDTGSGKISFVVNPPSVPAGGAG